jgi:2OG-Fe(II) oxygenase superfamily
MAITAIDREALRKQYLSAIPFPFVRIENFLEPTFAEKVASSYPTFEDAMRCGRNFKTINERKKIQITDARLFPGPVAQLNAALASPGFLSDLSFVTGISDLLADEELVGGGIHVTGPGGRLDVHVDFNYLETRKLHRRLNLLLYLNPIWEEQWGGNIQLWDKDVKHCRQEFSPALNRCVIFETSETSFHGVTPVTKEAPYPRISFATYYYTRQPPPDWKGTGHSTIFKARPEERLRKYVLMPAEALQHHLSDKVRWLKRGIKEIVHAIR